MCRKPNHLRDNYRVLICPQIDRCPGVYSQRAWVPTRSLGAREAARERSLARIDCLITVNDSGTWRRTSHLERPNRIAEPSLQRRPLLRRVAGASVLRTVRRELIEVRPKAGTQQHQVFRGEVDDDVRRSRAVRL